MSNMILRRKRNKIDFQAKNPFDQCYSLSKTVLIKKICTSIVITTFLTFCRLVSDIFGAFCAAAAGRRILEIEWALQHRTCLFDARQSLVAALTLHAGVLGQRHLSLLEHILAVQVAA